MPSVNFVAANSNLGSAGLRCVFYSWQMAKIAFFNPRFQESESGIFASRFATALETVDCKKRLDFDFALGFSKAKFSIPFRIRNADCGDTFSSRRR